MENVVGFIVKTFVTEIKSGNIGFVDPVLDLSTSLYKGLPYLLFYLRPFPYYLYSEYERHT